MNDGVLDLLNLQLRIDNNVINLTMGEAILLARLARASLGTIVSREELLGHRAVSKRVADARICGIRRKVGLTVPPLIRTHHEEGYSLLRPVRVVF